MTPFILHYSSQLKFNFLVTEGLVNAALFIGLEIK